MMNEGKSKKFPLGIDTGEEEKYEGLSESP
jgi:hypothetical protein